MTQEKDKKDESQKSWLKEHDSIQVDLLKMKDELVSEVKRTNGSDNKERGSDRSKGNETGPMEKPHPRPETERRNGNYQPEMTIKQMLGGEQKDEGSKSKTPPRGSPPRLEEGTIPSSPELTSKIANVLQLENKLKRRKFEIDKRSSRKDVPPPPQKPDDVEDGYGEIISQNSDTLREPPYGTEDHKEQKKSSIADGEERYGAPKNQFPKPTTKSSQKDMNRRADREEEEDELIEELEEFEEVEETTQKKKKRRGIFSLFSRRK